MDDREYIALGLLVDASGQPLVITSIRSPPAGGRGEWTGEGVIVLRPSRIAAPDAPPIR
jgi:hypothetical protein